jgi:hypothetical protein
MQSVSTFSNLFVVNIYDELAIFLNCLIAVWHKNKEEAK